MQNSDPLNLTFPDIKKFDIQNTITGNLLSQVETSKLNDKDITRKILGDLETAKLEDRLEELKKPTNLNEISDDNDDNYDDNDDYGSDLNQKFNKLRYGRVWPTPLSRNLPINRSIHPIPPRRTNWTELKLPYKPKRFIGIPQRPTASMFAPEDYHLLGDVGKPLSQFAPPSFRPLTSTAPPISPLLLEPSDNKLLKPTTLETNFNRPLTRLIDKQRNTVQIIWKTKKDELIHQFNLSDRFSNLLPNIDETVDEQNNETNELPIDKMTDILSQIDNDKIPLELEFLVVEKTNCLKIM